MAHERDHARRRAAAALLVRHRDLECRVEGASMAPTLPPGTTIRVEPVEDDGWRRGDVAVFHAGERLYSHRIVAVGRRGPARGHVLTMGDNRSVPDAPVERTDLLGRARLAAQDERIPAPTNEARARRMRSRLAAGLITAMFRVHPSLAESTQAALHRLARD